MLFKDANEFCKSCDACQRAWGLNLDFGKTNEHISQKKHFWSGARFYKSHQTCRTLYKEHIYNNSHRLCYKVGGS